LLIANTPELLTNLAASFVVEARRDPRGLGVLDEGSIPRGEYNFPEIVGLEDVERQILLDAAIVLFLEHNICFREPLGSQTFLVFPALINEKRPLINEIEIVDEVLLQKPAWHRRGVVGALD
jgi:hypothetical protein